MDGETGTASVSKGITTAKGHDRPCPEGGRLKIKQLQVARGIAKLFEWIVGQRQGGSVMCQMLLRPAGGFGEPWSPCPK